MMGCVKSGVPFCSLLLYCKNKKELHSSFQLTILWVISSKNAGEVLACGQYLWGMFALGGHCLRSAILSISFWSFIDAAAGVRCTAFPFSGSGFAVSLSPSADYFLSFWFRAVQAVSGIIHSVGSFISSLIIRLSPFFRGFFHQFFDLSGPSVQIVIYVKRCFVLYCGGVWSYPVAFAYLNTPCAGFPYICVFLFPFSRGGRISCWWSAVRGLRFIKANLTCCN